MNYFYSKLLDFYYNHPNLSIFLFSKLPLPLKNLIMLNSRGKNPVRKVNKLKKLELLPLDSSWAEVIIAPFHDPIISETLPIRLEPINAQGCNIDFSWCWTILSWTHCKKQDDALNFDLNVGLDLVKYNQILICLTLSRETSVHFEIKINDEWKKFKKDYRGTGNRMEIALPVDVGTLNIIRFCFKSESSIGQKIQLSWIGLRNSALLKLINENKHIYDTDWPGLIKPIDDLKSIKFEMGLLFDESELKWLREKKSFPWWSINYKLLEKKANEYLNRHPENDLSNYLPLDDTRYLRESEVGKTPFYFEAIVLGFVGLINEDNKMIKHALRYLMCMVHTKHWTQSAESRLPGSTWDQRCFLEEMTTTSVSILADWFAFALTDRAKELIRQSIYDKGIAVIERDMIKYEYLYRINQGAVFCRARILGGLYLEKSWPRVGTLVDRAFKDMTKCLSGYIGKDGGTPEGIGYFCQTLQATMPSIFAYARNKGTRPAKYIKKIYKNCENYVATMSASIPGTAIVEGDCRTNYFSGDGIPILARFFPGGVCDKILGACIETGNLFSVTGTLSNSGGIFGFVYGPDKVTEPKCVSPTFSVLPKSGHLASFRVKDSLSVRFHLTGSRSFVSHTHLDKGSIILEINRVPVLIDRGMVNYYHSQSLELKRSCMHNVITPYLEDGTYPDQSQPFNPIIPKGHGTTESIRASIDLTNVWTNYMMNCSRFIISEKPDEFLIIDEGRFPKPERIAFHLHANFPFEITNKKVAVQTGNSIILIEADWANEVFCLQELIDLHHNPVYHLIIHGSPTDVFKINTKIKIK